MKEVWKDIEGYEGYYQISNLGRYRSLDRYVNVGNGGRRLVKGKMLVPVVCTNGYIEANLNKKQERKVFLMHRLVAKHFIDNPNNYPEVNHKDENPRNNCVDNLEWCTSKYNANYGTRNKRSRDNGPLVSVDQYELDGTFVRNWESASDAARFYRIRIENITRVCKGRRKTTAGYLWRFTEKEVVS